MKRLKELFDKIVPYRIIKDSDRYFIAQFEVEGVRYAFEAMLATLPYSSDIVPSYDLVWEIEFSASGSYSRLDTGNQFTVFSTVGKLTMDLVKKHKPTMFMYSSAKDEHRESLYSIFAKELCKKIPYTVITELDRHGFTNFVFSRK